MTFMTKTQKKSKQADNGIFFRFSDVQGSFHPLKYTVQYLSSSTHSQNGLQALLSQGKMSKISFDRQLGCFQCNIMIPYLYFYV